MVTSSSLFIKKKKPNISVGILRGARNGEGGGGGGGGGKIRSKMTRCKILYACTLLKGNSSDVRSL